jgi:site-specific recombinase XerD
MAGSRGGILFTAILLLHVTEHPYSCNRSSVSIAPLCPSVRTRAGIASARDRYGHALFSNSVEKEKHLYGPDGSNRDPRCKSEMGKLNMRFPEPRQFVNPVSPEIAISRLSGPMTIGDFLKLKFVPEFVVNKRTAGRNHFKAMLKYVIPPEHVARLLPSQPGRVKAKLAFIPGWPYIDKLSLSEVNGDVIERLISAALERGYSVQTATHVRNVIRSIFSHAIRTGFYLQPNPAASVTLPRIERKADQSLALSQLQAVLGTMGYPERELALLTVLTDMTIAEICGLQWKHVNLFNSSRIVEGELIPPIAAVVRRQNYRGVLSNVIRSRKRIVPITHTLATLLNRLKARKQFTGPDDFVLISRNGNPIHPENLAARRLKFIGESLQIPGLAWSVFYKTRMKLRAELGTSFYEQFNDVVSFPQSIQPLFHERPRRSTP